MKRIFLTLFSALALSSAASAAVSFVDCGAGYVKANGKNRDGIPTIECKKLFCRDLENGRVMGTEAGMAAGYENKGLVFVEDNKGNGIECFGQRKWCNSVLPGQEGLFNAEYGIYTKGGEDGDAYRGVLRGNCFEWQTTGHSCRPGETAVIDKDTSSWICLTSGGVNGGRSAVKVRAARRTSVMTSPVKR